MRRRSHLLVLTPRLWPVHQGRRARAVADFLDALSTQGAHISVLTITEPGAKDVGLARCLTPLTLSDPVADRQVEWFRGQTPSASAQVCAVSLSDWARLGPVGQRLGRERAAIDLTLAIDEAIAAISPQRGGRSVAMLTTEPSVVSDPWMAGLERAGAVLVPSHQLAAHPTETLGHILGGCKRVLGFNLGGRSHRAASETPALRRSLGLGRRGPLAVTHGSINLQCTGGWQRMLRTPARIVAIDDGRSDLADVRELADNKPRSLVILGAGDERAPAIRAAASLHIFADRYRPGGNSELAAASGGIAIAHSSGEFHDRIVPWDSRSRSGNGFLYGDGELASTLALACQNVGDPGLRRAAATLDTSWARAARLCAHLSEATAKN